MSEIDIGQVWSYRVGDTFPFVCYGLIINITYWSDEAVEVELLSPIHSSVTVDASRLIEYQQCDVDLENIDKFREVNGHELTPTSSNDGGES